VSFVLDTCVLSELARPVPDRGLTLWFEAQEAEALFLSVLTVGELEQGIAVLSAGRKRSALTTWLATLRSTFADRILPIDIATAAVWGRAAARARRRGRRLAVIDGLIAAAASHHGYTVVTRNVADFEAAGVSLLNPWRG
jgi:predicted nucleic acid-binding protein